MKPKVTSAPGIVAMVITIIFAILLAAGCVAPGPSLRAVQPDSIVCPVDSSYTAVQLSTVMLNVPNHVGWCYMKNSDIEKFQNNQELDDNIMIIEFDPGDKFYKAMIKSREIIAITVAVSK